MDEYMENSNADQIDVLADQDTAAEMDETAAEATGAEQQEEAPAAVLEVISVDELLQRITENNSADTMQTDAAAREISTDPLEITEEPAEESSVMLRSTGSDPDYESLLDYIGQQIHEVVEYVTVEDGDGLQHYYKTTDINDLTFSEMMLLLIFMVVFIDFCIRTIRRWI